MHPNIFRNVSSLYLNMHRIKKKKKKKKEENNISTIKTDQMPNKWQCLTCIKASFSNQNLENDIVTPRL